MLFEVKEEHTELRSSVRQFLTAVSPEAAVRREMESELGFDRAVWRRASAELGLTALAVPEAYGGMGFGFAELAIVLEEGGRSLLCAPLLSTTVLATRALLAAADEASSARWLPGIAEGTTLATLAFQEDRRDWAGTSCASRAEQADGSWRLTGHKELVLDGHVADLILVTANTEAGPSLFAVTGEASGLTRTPLFTVDQTRRLAALDFDAVPAELVGQLGGAAAVLADVLDHAAVALALEAVGAAQQLLDLTVAYAGDRVQFGRRIGSFQAVKHALVDVHVDVELARSVAWSAADAADNNPADLPLQAALAKSFCTDAAVSSAGVCLQAFGGIGFTWEHPAHLYLKRAEGSALMFGRPSDHRAALAATLEFPGATIPAGA